MPNARERGNNILRQPEGRLRLRHQQIVEVRSRNCVPIERLNIGKCVVAAQEVLDRSEEHTSELQSLMRISYAVFCLKKKKRHTALVTKKEHNRETKNTKNQY